MPDVISAYDHELAVSRLARCPYRENHACHLKGVDLSEFQACLLCLLGTLVDELKRCKA